MIRCPRGFGVRVRVGQGLLRLTACVAAVVCCVAGAPLPARAADTTDAIVVVDAFHAALRRGFTEVVLDFLDYQVIIYESGHVERSSREYATAHLRADMRFSAATTRTITNRKSDRVGDLAWVITEARVTGEYEGKPVDQITLETMILRRSIRGNWYITHIHWSSKPAPAN
jgi:ketosteroid isomerase-like protein